MLSAAEAHAIEHELEHYEDARACSIEALKIVQQHRGWVSDEALKDIADKLGISTAELDSVATFYPLIFRREVGRNVIMACDSITCYMQGADRLRNMVSDKLGIGLGQTTPDKRFTLLPICCLGTCDRAPAMMIGQDLHRDLENVSSEQLDAILAKYA